MKKWLMGACALALSSAIQANGIGDMFQMARQLQDPSNGMNQINQMLQIQQMINHNHNQAAMQRAYIERVNAENALRAARAQQELQALQMQRQAQTRKQHFVAQAVIQAPLFDYFMASNNQGFIAYLNREILPNGATLAYTANLALNTGDTSYLPLMEQWAREYQAHQQAKQAIKQQRNSKAKQRVSQEEMGYELKPTSVY